MSRFDYVVVGGGIVGLSVAWAILDKKPSSRLIILEKEKELACHQTGRNSGVIHSGIYYKPGSLKATLCQEGNRRLIAFCETHGVHYERCGKVIVATRASELPGLEKLYERGVANGLAIKRLNASEVQEIEPYVRCLAGIHVPSAGIVDYKDVCRKLSRLIQERGGELRLRTRVLGVRVNGSAAYVETTTGDLATAWVVNCAGLQSDRMAKSSGTEPEAQIIPFRGEYYELKPERRSLVRNLIYPVPDPQFPFLGVHFTRMIDNAVHAGPNAVLSFKREGYTRTSFDLRDFLDTIRYPGFWRLASKHAWTGWEEWFRSLSKQAFVRSLQQLIPEVRGEDLIESTAGVRAQALRRNGELVDDFLILTGSRTLHVCNAPSPAATASLVIGETIARQIPD